MALAVGETVDRYTVEAWIGQGGMGEVYRAVDNRLRRRVALKVVRAPDQPEAVARLFREARAAAAFSHPNTVSIHDLLETDEQVTIVMELVSGKPLRAHIGDASVPFARRVEWLSAIARALGAAHRAGVIHRDVKPSNVMITEDGAVKVLDFGLARRREAASEPANGFETERGHVVGTPKYMAPEQAAGADLDARSDQYQFGVVAFELLSGQHPGLPGEARAPLELVSKGVSKAVLRALAPEPGDRFETMDEVALALEDGLLDRVPSTAPDDALAPTQAPPTEPMPTEPVPTESSAPRAETAPMPPLTSYRQRLAAIERAHPQIETLLSREAPSGLHRVLKAARAKANAAEARAVAERAPAMSSRVDVTLKSGEDPAPSAPQRVSVAVVMLCVIAILLPLLGAVAWMTGILGRSG